jgi:23S rRNA-/tRNA-specific pseudouridylate synthase
MGGMRLDQALAQLFPQYSRNRLQVWLKSGHIRIEGAGMNEAKNFRFQVPDWRDFVLTTDAPLLGLPHTRNGARACQNRLREDSP